MEPKFSTLDLAPRVRPTGYRVAVAVLGLGLIGAVAGHLRAIGELRQEMDAEADKIRSCEASREAVGNELKALRSERDTTAAAAAAPSEPAAETPAPAEPASHGAPGVAPPSEEAVMTMVGDGQDKLQACYRRALRRNPDLGTKPLRLRLSFTLRSSGDVRRVGFSPSPVRELRSCLRDVVGRWKVKPFGGDSIAVEVPITLKPRG